MTISAAIGVALLAIGAQPDVRRSPPAWSEEFAREIAGWSIDRAQGSTVAGELRLFPTQLDSPGLASHSLPAANFVVETRARVVSGSADNGYGIAVGNADALTAFLISGDGYFSVVRRTDDGWGDVQPWRQWPHVRRGTAPNVLRLACDGEACTFYVNDEVTTQVAVGRRRESVGLIGWRYTPEELSVAFDYLRVW